MQSQIFPSGWPPTSSAPASSPAIRSYYVEIWKWWYFYVENMNGAVGGYPARLLNALAFVVALSVGILAGCVLVASEAVEWKPRHTARQIPAQK
jgi:hypothetical protein